MANDFRDSLERVFALSPVLRDHPNQATALALTPGVTDTDIEALGGYQQGTVWRNYLEGLSPERQDQEWGRMTAAQRQLTESAGFQYRNAALIAAQQAPPPVVEKQSWWQRTKSEWGHTGGQALEAAGKPLEFVNHFARANMAVAQMDPDHPSFLMPLAAIGGWGAGLRNPDAYAKAWRETRDGEKAYDSRALKEVESSLPPTYYALGRRIAEGENLDSILNSATTQAERDLYDQMAQSPLLQEAVDAVNGAKLSIGRATARSLGLRHQDHEGWFTAVSGSIDAANALFLDPLIVGGKTAQVVKGSRRGLRGLDGDRIDELFDGTSTIRALGVDTKIPASPLARRAGGQTGVARYFENALPHVNAIARGEADKVGQSWEQLNTNYKQLVPMVDDLVKYSKNEADGNLDVEGVKSFFKGQIGREHLMNGESAVRSPLMPTKGVIADLVGDKIRDGVRKYGLIGLTSNPGKFLDDVTLKSLDEAEDAGVAEARGKVAAELRKKSRLYRTGMNVSRLVEQTAVTKSGQLDLTDDLAPKVIYQFARSYMPRWHANQVAGAFVAADLGGRKQIYKGILRSNAEAAGITSHEQGRKWLQDRINDIDGGPQNRGYSAVEGNDVYESGTRHALYAGQMTSTVPLPSFREMHNMSAFIGITSRLGQVTTVRALDNFMEKIWRPGVLIRPALAFRNALEENTNHITKHGVWDWSKGQYVRHLVDVKAKEFARTGMVADMDSRISGLRGKLLSDTDRKYLQELDEEALESYLEGIRGTSTRAANNREMGQGPQDGNWTGRRGMREYEIKYKQGENYRPQDTVGGVGVARWTHQALNLVNDQTGRIALTHIDDHDTAVAKLQETILSDGFAGVRRDSRAWAEMVGEGADEATEAAAARTWAERIYVDVRHHFSDRDGNLLDDLLKDVRVTRADGTVGINREAISTRRLGEIEEARRPASVIAGDTIMLEAQGSGMYTRLVERGYELTGQLTGLLGKNAIHWANYMDARKANEVWQRQLSDDFFEGLVNSKRVALDSPQAAKLREQADAAAAKIVMKQSMRRAEMTTLSYVDNPDIRSQAAVILRNVAPFWRAQEEFYRRWGRTVRHNPEAFRRMQLAFEGAQESGVTETDEDGNRIFIYPATRPVQELMYNVGQKFGWNWAMSPVPHPYTSQVRFLNQGMDPKNIQPSFGPVAGVPLKSIEWLFPESRAIKAANRTVLGDMAANQSDPISGLMPTFFRRLHSSLTDSDQYASALKQTIVNLEAAGRTPPDGADEAVLEDYLEDASKWTRVSMVMRAIFGTTAPAAPQEMGASGGAPIGDGPPNPDGGKELIPALRRHGLPTVSAEFRAEVARVEARGGTYNEALQNWMRTRPHDLPFTVGTTEAKYGGFLPATKDALEFFEGNKQLFDNFPAAAVMFLPQASGDFDMDSYRAQLGAGLRQRKDIKEFARDLKLAGNLQTYYDMKQDAEARASAARAAGNIPGARQIDDEWATASKVFKASHPSVGKYLGDYQGRQADRERITQELNTMIESGSVPRTPAGQAITYMVQAYNKRQEMLAQAGGSRSVGAVATRERIKAGFQEYAKDLASKDANADLLYQRLFRGLEDD